MALRWLLQRAAPRLQMPSAVPAALQTVRLAASRPTAAVASLLPARRSAPLRAAGVNLITVRWSHSSSGSGSSSSDNDATISKLQERLTQATLLLSGSVSESGSPPTVEQAHAVVDALNELAVELLRRGRGAEAAEHWERAVSVSDQAGGSSPARVAALLCNAAAAQIYVGGTKRKAYLERALALLQKQPPTAANEVLIAVVLVNLGATYGVDGDPTTKLALTEWALSILERHPDQTQLEVADVLSNLGDVNRVLGKTSDAQRLLERALALSERRHGPDSDKVARILGNLGAVYGVQRDGARHRACAERALRIFERLYGPDHPDVAVALGSLGNAHYDAREFQQARGLQERALAIKERQLGHDHPDVAVALKNLGHTYKAVGDRPRQVAALERALGIFERQFGPGHEAAERARRQLARARSDARDATDAGSQEESATAAAAAPPGARADGPSKVAMLERAVATLEQRGDDDERLVQRLIELGVVVGIAGDFARRRDLFERALAVRERMGSATAAEPDLATVLTNLGNAYIDVSDFDKARTVFERACTLKEAQAGPDSLDMAWPLQGLGSVCGAVGDFARQLVVLERALAIQERHLVPTHQDLATTLQSLGNAVGAARGDYAAQRTLQERALAIEERHHGPDHINVGNVLANLGNAYWMLNETALAKTSFERALAIFERKFGPDHAKVGVTLASIAGILHHDDPQRQVGMLERAIAMLRRHLVPDSPEEGVASYNLAVAYAALHDREQARASIQRAATIMERRFGPADPRTQAARRFQAKLG